MVFRPEIMKHSVLMQWEIIFSSPNLLLHDVGATGHLKSICGEHEHKLSYIHTGKRM